MKQILCRYCSYEHHKPALFHFHCFLLFLFLLLLLTNFRFYLPCSVLHVIPSLSSLLAWERKIWMITGWLIAMALDQPITGRRFHSRPITGGQYHSRPITSGQYHSWSITGGQYQRTVSLGIRSEKISIFPKNFTEPT